MLRFDPRPGLWLLFLVAAPVQAEVREEGPPRYRQAPPEIREILDAPPAPRISLSPTRDRLLLVQGLRYPPIRDLAQPMLALAGERIDPRTNGPHRPPRYTSLTLQEIEDGTELQVRLPADASLGFPSWSPDGRTFALTNTLENGIELRVGDARTGQTRAVPNLRINAACGEPFRWMPDGRTLLCRTVPSGRADPPAPPEIPLGPIIQETTGSSGPVRTYQDLLQSPHDADLFDFYATSQLVLVDVETLRGTELGPPAVIAEAAPAPDGEHLLVVTRRRPYSYLHLAERFPTRIEVWNRSGAAVFQLADLPLSDQVPIEGVPTGPRSPRWHPTEPASLIWIEALDGGDPRLAASHRDQVRMLPAPFEGSPVELARTEYRFSGLLWGERGGLALLRDYDRDRRWSRTFLIRSDRPGHPGKLVWDRSVLDRYGDPGMPLMRPLPTGHRALWQEGKSLFLTGQGASPQGDRPFLDRFDLETFETERLFACAEGCYESVVALGEEGAQWIVRHESPDSPPNYFLRSNAPETSRPLTRFSDPAPQLRKIRKELVTYERADGVPLSFTLYLPADYQPGERLPTIVWAYPREYTDPGTAGQVSGSPHRFTTLDGASHLFLLTQGYAILDGATMPVVGDPQTANDTYVEQIVSSARAAIEKGVELGVTDPDRVGVAGHSYGAFMTANLLAHSDLFRAGVARSGAFNRTLTPFGFQSERRTFWEAPQTYFTVSPFMSAHQIRDPLLLIHGAADNNSGTFPMQSERMYQAIRGNGGTARLVMLPYESHGYLARESIEHVLSETLAWFDRHVKDAPAPVRE